MAKAKTPTPPQAAGTHGAPRDYPFTRSLRIIAQDPAVRPGGRILTTTIDVPAEELAPGPCGYRVNVIDFDSNTGALYEPATYRTTATGKLLDPFADASDATLLGDPRFHAQNSYAIAMKTLARFEFALGRRVRWGSDGHQLYVAPHAFTDANAFYSKEDRGLFFGYFPDPKGRQIFTCLSHDIVAHETTHALLDGLRSRYMEASSPQQAAFHEGFADIVALLSVFALEDVVAALLKPRSRDKGKLIAAKHLTAPRLKRSVLFGLALEMGQAMAEVRGEALRRSITKNARRSLAGVTEEHDLGEYLVAGMLNAFLAIWVSRLNKIGTVRRGLKDLSLVVEQGAQVANHLLTMAIRALDYCPPTDIDFSDFLSALLTIDHEVVPDDSRFGYRKALLDNFARYGIRPSRSADPGGIWQRCLGELKYSRTHFDSMLRDKEEVFRFVWENREALEISDKGYVEVQSVSPSHRIGPDGFVLRETIAEYVQIMTLRADELGTLRIRKPRGMPDWKRVRLFGGGALVFDEYGRLKYQIRNRIENARRQTARLKFLWETGFFDEQKSDVAPFALAHRRRAGS